MKRFVVALCFSLAMSTLAFGYGYGTGSNPNNHYVNPYVRSNGTYTPSHYQTNPNYTDRDNYGTRGNFNPYTGQRGMRSPRDW